MTRLPCLSWGLESMSPLNTRPSKIIIAPSAQRAELNMKQNALRLRTVEMFERAATAPLEDYSRTVPKMLCTAFEQEETYVLGPRRALYWNEIVDHGWKKPETVHSGSAFSLCSTLLWISRGVCRKSGMAYFEGRSLLRPSCCVLDSLRQIFLFLGLQVPPSGFSVLRDSC